MQKPLVLALFFLSSLRVCFPQLIDNQSAPSQSSAPDCSDPLTAGSPECGGTPAQRSNGAQGTDNPVRPPVLNSPGTVSPDQYTPSAPPTNPSQITRTQAPIRPETEFEQMVADTVGRPLPLFGQSLFLQAPSTFSPIDWMPVPDDYIIGPGDELQIDIWGQVEANFAGHCGPFWPNLHSTGWASGCRWYPLRGFRRTLEARDFEDIQKFPTYGKYREASVNPGGRGGRCSLSRYVHH